MCSTDINLKTFLEIFYEKINIYWFFYYKFIYIYIFFYESVIIFFFNGLLTNVSKATVNQTQKIKKKLKLIILTHKWLNSITVANMLWPNGL